MSEIILKIENLSKQYRLGVVGTGTLSHDLNRWWHKIRGKEDPFLKIGEVNDRATKGTSDYVWALKDINFEVKKGEVLGIIGKNGAGKSTLLKILSKVTGPTTGSIKSKGRIASLLEVGTGFHPELTGRENIYLNGAILGMTKNEINAKLDEIISFAGVERYIDTPVKRYSSGMTVRLAFSVAAHLEPDILVIDEVLAVGDAEFQKKAIGKMQDIYKSEGRTVLFVSHNMAAVKSLCTRGIVLEKGEIACTGNIEKVLSKYNSSGLNTETIFQHQYSSKTKTNHQANITSVKIESGDNKGVFFIEDDIQIKIFFSNPIKGNLINISLSIFDENDVYILSSPNLERSPLQEGDFLSICTIPGGLFNVGKYFFTILLVGSNNKIISQLDKVVSVEFKERGDDRENYFGTWKGIIRPMFKWKNIQA
ncbi:ABC transporter ATP-binding protein [Lutibacter sp.]